MRLSPLLLGLTAFGFGWASPVLAQDGADCGFLCQIGGYLSTDHMTASPGDAGAGTPAKPHKAHAAHRASAKLNPTDTAHAAPPAAEHAAARAGSETRTVPAATPVKAAAPKVAATTVAAPKSEATKAVATKAVATKAGHGEAEGGKAVLAKAAVEPAVRKPAPNRPKAQVADSHPTPTPGATAAKIGAKPVAPKAAATQTATATPDRSQARKRADRTGGSVEIASASAVPSPSFAAVPAKPVRTARAALPRHTPVALAAQADRPVILLSALAAIPGSAPAISAGFQPAAATAH